MTNYFILVQEVLKTLQEVLEELCFTSDEKMWAPYVYKSALLKKGMYLMLRSSRLCVYFSEILQQTLDGVYTMPKQNTTDWDSGVILATLSIPMRVILSVVHILGE